MDAAELAEARDEVQIVDVRWPNEWDAGHIEGAIHVPQDEVDDRIGEGIGEIAGDRRVATVCRTGSRSAAAAESLKADGYDAESLDGGLEAWAAAGLPLVAADGQPGRVVEPEPPPDDRPESQQRLQQELLAVLFAVQDHFGDREPSDDEVRAFLRQRLIDEGKSPAEAHAFLAAADAHVYPSTGTADILDP